MNKFIGNIDAKADVKGRVFVPATFRRILQTEGETHLVLRKDIFQDCLVLYPASEWDNELNILQTRLNNWDKDERQLLRQLSLEVEILEIDASGRILIPKKYMQMAKITTDIRFIGIGRNIEIWNKEVLEKATCSPDVFKENVKKYLNSK